MAHNVVTKLYTAGVAVPVSGAPIVIPSESFWVAEIDVPPVGFINHLAVIQTDGTSVAFTVELLKSVAVYATGVHANADDEQDPIELYRAIPSQIVSNPGEALEVFNSQNGYAFRNMDADFANAARKLYLVIMPTESGDETTWKAALTIHTGNAGF